MSLFARYNVPDDTRKVYGGQDCCQNTRRIDVVSRSCSFDDEVVGLYDVILFAVVSQDAGKFDAVIVSDDRAKETWLEEFEE